MVYRDKCIALIGLGKEDEALTAYEKAYSILKKDSMRHYYEEYGAQFLKMGPKTPWWHHSLMCAELKEVSFGNDGLTYKDLKNDLYFSLPYDWKIYAEIRDDDGELQLLGFSSQIYWDKTGKVPINACIDMMTIYYDERRGFKDQVEDYVSSFKKSVKSMIWTFDNTNKDIKYDNLIINYNIYEKLPKSGKYLAFHKGKTILIFNLMSLDPGKGKFALIFENFTKSIFRQMTEEN